MLTGAPGASAAGHARRRARSARRRFEHAGVRVGIVGDRFRLVGTRLGLDRRVAARLRLARLIGVRLRLARLFGDRLRLGLGGARRLGLGVARPSGSGASATGSGSSASGSGASAPDRLALVGDRLDLARRDRGGLRLAGHARLGLARRCGLFNRRRREEGSGRGGLLLGEQPLARGRARGPLATRRRARGLRARAAGPEDARVAGIGLRRDGRGGRGDRRLTGRSGAVVERVAAAEAVVGVAGEQLAALLARAADAGLAQHGLGVRLAEARLERADLGVECGEALGLRLGQLALLGAEIAARRAVDLVQEPAEVAQEQLADAPQVTQATAQPAATGARRRGDLQLDRIDARRQVASGGGRRRGGERVRGRELVRLHGGDVDRRADDLRRLVRARSRGPAECSGRAGARDAGARGRLGRDRLGAPRDGLDRRRILIRGCRRPMLALAVAGRAGGPLGTADRVRRRRTGPAVGGVIDRRGGGLVGSGRFGPGLVGGRRASACQASQQAAHT